MKLRSFGAPMERSHRWIAVIVAAGFTMLAGCVVYEPVPTTAPAPGAFDRSWSVALAAAQDEGVRIISEDRVSGVILGYRDEQEVTIKIRTQADGNVRVEMSARAQDRPGLAGRISRAYDRRMDDKNKLECSLNQKRRRRR
jgi:hypothetical protein